ncbi:MAG: hypothetical protein PHD48_10570 [Alphaproteobacteria bacterium]|nr:hypothetical protein [Alphaproteobacteria bacterium]
MHQKQMLRIFFVGLLLALQVPTLAYAARDAAFLDPGASSSPAARSADSIFVEPKSETDVGDTPPSTSRRATFFFVNQTNLPITVENITANGDSNVRAEIVSDDCTKGRQITAGSRCSVAVEVTPIGTGSWAAELLMTHNAAGRIARARIIGRTTKGPVEKQDMGLSLNTKDVKPVDFGDVIMGGGKAVRTALMVNDSSDEISLLSIEVIAAENGLQRLDQGCAPDIDLKPGESCPITLVWKPETKNNVSTDLIIRHSGRLGFVVIPIRGVAKEIVEKDGGGRASASSATTSSLKTGLADDKSGKLQPPSVADLAQLLDAKNIPPLSAQDIPELALGSRGGDAASSSPTVSLDNYRLIGTVGNRAVIYKTDGSTIIVGLGEAIDTFGDKSVQLVNISPRSVEIFFDGKKKALKLEAVASLAEKARAARKSASSSSNDSKKASSKKSVAGEDTNAVPLPVGRK